MRTNASSRKGSALVEAIVGISIVLLAMSAIISMVVRAFSINNDISNRFIATNLSAEGVELMKYYLITDWESVGSGFYEVQYDCDSPACITTRGGLSDRYLLLNKNTGLYEYATGVTTPFKRTVVVDWASGYAKIASVVQWVYKGEAHEVQMDEKLYLWRK